MRCVWAGLALTLALLTGHRAQIYQTDHSVWADASFKAPHKPRPLLNYGAALIIEGRYTEAEALSIQAMHEAETRTGWENQQGRAISLANRGVIKLYQDDRRMARMLVRQSLAVLPKTAKGLCQQIGCDEP